MTEFTKKMFQLMFEFRIWAESRPEHEHATQGEQVSAGVELIDGRETDQGMFFFLRPNFFLGMPEHNPVFCRPDLTRFPFFWLRFFFPEHARLSLVSFVASVRHALAALTSF